MTQKTPYSLQAKLPWHPSKWTCAVLTFAILYAVVLAANLTAAAVRWDEVNHLNGPLLLLRGQIWDYAAYNSYYPPLYNLVTAGFFTVLGASVFSARVVALAFSVLCILLVYKMTKDFYSARAGFVAAVLFSVMPGIVWLSSAAMIDIMLIFALTFSLLFFFKWRYSVKKSDLALCIAGLVLGSLVKYQVLVLAPVIMVLSLPFLGMAGKIKAHVAAFMRSRIFWLGVVCLLLVAAFLVAYSASGLLNVLLYVMQYGNAGQLEYSTRFATPVFYLIEMVWPYSDMHPISLILYGFGLAGLVFLAYRRKPQDKLLLVWFIATYVIFTLISNRQWRYVAPLFPVLAISAAELTAAAYGKAQKVWRSASSTASKRRLAKASAAVLLVFTVGGVFVSALDAYSWVQEENRIQVPAEEASTYLASKTISGSVLVLFPFNRLNQDMVWFYLNSKTVSPVHVYQYPALPVDAYPLEFNATELVSFCRSNGTQFVLLYEYESTPTYYGSSLNEQAVYSMLNSTGNFVLAATFGEAPRRMFVMSFNAANAPR